ncbi:ATP-binding protein, partial [Salinisphaera orenii]
LDLLPELGQRLPHVKPAAPLSAPTQARFRLFEAIGRVWQRFARQQPLLLVFDNLHLADSASFRLLEFLAPELGESPLLLLSTYRDLEISREHPFLKTLSELVRLPQCQRLSLTGLNRPETDQLLHDLAGQRPPPPALAAAIHAHSEGNPLFIRELAQSLFQQGLLGVHAQRHPDNVQIPIPAGIREVLRQRLDRLSQGCGDLLCLACVIGREFELELLVGLTDDLSIASVLDALDEALGARLIEALAQPGRYQFSHALVRETLYDELASNRRLQLHQRIGEKLVELHGDRATAQLARLAYHFGRAAPLGTAHQAMAYAEQAGARADKLLAYEEAARLYSLALDLQSRYAETDAQFRLLLALGTSQYRAGAYVTAMTTFQSAAVNAASRHAGEELARAALGYEEASWRPGLPGTTACQLLRDALAAVDAGDSALRARLLSSLTRALIFTGDVDRSTQIQAQAVAVA